MRHPSLFKANIAAIFVPLILLWLAQRMVGGLARMFYPGAAILLVLGCLSALCLWSSWRSMRWLGIAANGVVAIGSGVVAGGLFYAAGRPPFGPLVAMILAACNFVAFWGLIFVDDATWTRNGHRLLVHRWTFITNVICAFWGCVYLAGVGVSVDLIGLTVLAVLSAFALLPLMLRPVVRAVAFLNVGVAMLLVGLGFVSYFRGGMGAVPVGLITCCLALLATNLRAFLLILRGDRKSDAVTESGFIGTTVY